jgi:hypothetical protein
MQTSVGVLTKISLDWTQFLTAITEEGLEELKFSEGPWPRHQPRVAALNLDE